MSVSVELSRDRSVLVVHDVVNSFLDPEGSGYDSDLPSVMANIVDKPLFQRAQIGPISCG